MLRLAQRATLCAGCLFGASH